MKISKYGFLRVKAISPMIEIANVKYNVDQMLVEIKKAYSETVSVAVFPEMGLTGYTIEDLNHQQYLLDNARRGLSRLLSETKYLDMFIACGLPYQMPDGRLYNTAVVLHKGKILGMTLKKYLPNYSEFYDMRFFASGLDRAYSLEFEGQRFEAGNQLYQLKNPKGRVLGTLGVEICEDSWAIFPPSFSMAMWGCDIAVNLSASNALVGKNQYRKELISQLSGRLNCCYIYASAGPNESVKDTVFSGCTYIYENGNLLAEGDQLLLDSTGSATADLDLQKIAKERRQNTTFGTGRPQEQYSILEVVHDPRTEELVRYYPKNPFVPSDDPTILADRCEEILEILATGLARQMKGTKLFKLCVGQSGGLDSTAVSLIARRSLLKLGLPITNLYSISLPGFGTSDRTKSQSHDLAKSLGSTFVEVSIIPEVTQHLKDIQQPEKLYDATYENSQARARTKFLFNWANRVEALHISGSSLSEQSQGWATYCGDSVSSYNLMGSCPKTLTKHLLAYEASKNPELKDIIDRVLSTIISPELLPTTDKSIISQDTQKTIGSYDLIDCILYLQVKNGFDKNKIKFILNHIYRFDSSMNPKTLNEVVESYFKRFYANQFKRTCVPSSIKLGVDLSPRASWRMPDLSKYEDEDESED